MKLFTESLRYDYPDITPESVVLDIGAHEGNFAHIINEKYGCRVIGFEPVPDFFWRTFKRFADHPHISIFPYAVGSLCGSVDLGIKGCMSGALCDSKTRIDARMISIEEAVGYSRIYTPALVKLNIEGAEFDVLEAALARGLVPRVKHWQIQPHSHVEDAAGRWLAIDAQMRMTHDLVYHEPWCWSGYTLRA